MGEGKLIEALDDLQIAEAEYRRNHDLYGTDNMNTGRAWDRMRRAGDRARAAISLAQGEGQQRPYDAERHSSMYSGQ